LTINRRAAVISLACLSLTPVAEAAKATKAAARPPVARIEPVSETYFGREVIDPYRWMENPKDSAWEPFLRGQDAYARSVLAGIPGRDALGKRVAELSGGTAIAYGVQSRGGNVFYEVRPAGADNFKLAVRKGLAGAERILIDPTTMKSDDGKHLPLDWWRASPDGRLVVYGLSPAGSENRCCR
jgi:prolyl oligopeptidase